MTPTDALAAVLLPVARRRLPWWRAEQLVTKLVSAGGAASSALSGSELKVLADLICSGVLVEAVRGPRGGARLAARAYQPALAPIITTLARRRGVRAGAVLDAALFEVAADVWWALAGSDEVVVGVAAGLAGSWDGDPDELASAARALVGGGNGTPSS